ncbi:MCP four helix bundle domain-containing protein [Pedobacter endophyticus]|uniref:MCP four helix bundle domain-containing protein n=1 Tax=Pedobacter endophyticus TaxID=2789740 RepID=A0A7S9L230_9SPHI|nr:MCP four helix bundle domain-containing protein [Pedobacter endophyticus]QPH40819.1 MCP four helix bundle domain-containing protein [Pedobacter endophyticus]
MKFAFALKNKIKIAFLLFCIMCCILLIRFLEDKSVAKINESFVSMYQDRLVPAIDLFFVAENLYLKNTVFQDAFANNFGHPSTEISKITGYNNKIDSVITKYEKTLLVNEEKKFLGDLKKALTVQNQIEKKVLNLSVADGDKIYQSSGRQASTATLNKLSALIKIQSEVGDELIKDSRIFVSGTKIYSTLQIILAVLIGIMIVAIIYASNVVNVQNEKFRLN